MYQMKLIMHRISSYSTVLLYIRGHGDLGFSIYHIKKPASHFL